MLIAAAAEAAAAYATENQLVFEQRAQWDAAQVPASLSKLVFFQSPAFDPAQVDPSVSMVGIGLCESAQANVAPLCLGGAAADQAAFVAGYLSGMMADDWRVGMLYSAASASLVNNFRAGAEYFCGSCVPLSPPLTEYPLSVQVDGGWQAAADLMLVSQARVIFLPADVAASEAGPYLAGFGVLYVGTAAPPESLAGSWLASVTADPVAALRQALPAALAGQQAQVQSSLALTYVNSGLLSDARLAHIQQIIADLASGFITLPASQ